MTLRRQNYITCFGVNEFPQNFVQFYACANLGFNGYNRQNI